MFTRLFSLLTTDIFIPNYLNVLDRENDMMSNSYGDHNNRRQHISFIVENMHHLFYLHNLPLPDKVAAQKKIKNKIPARLYIYFPYGEISKNKRNHQIAT